MTPTDKLQELRALITDRLTPLVNHDYRYLMMCDHQNVGDTLIMEGELQFLKTIKHANCKEYTTMRSFEQRSPKISKDDLLIMRGSGSFGDIWPTAPNFWKFVMRQYPDNPILFMPQTIHFDEEHNLSEMATLINRHKKVILCVRDLESFKIAKSNFNCEIHLVPDMAFFIDNKALSKNEGFERRPLVVMRTDKEKKQTEKTTQFIQEIDALVSDWPTFSFYGRIEQIKQYLLRKRQYRLYDLFIKNVYRPYIIRKGVDFLMPYTEIYATRMHAGILAMLMGKRVHFIDNSYGKIGRVFNTWLKDTEKIYLDLE